MQVVEKWRRSLPQLGEGFYEPLLDGESLGLIQLSAPNRFRKLAAHCKHGDELKNSQPDIISKQRAEFPQIVGEPLGLDCGLDFDEVLTWKTA